MTAAENVAARCALKLGLLIAEQLAPYAVPHWKVLMEKTAALRHIQHTRARVIAEFAARESLPSLRRVGPRRSLPSTAEAESKPEEE